jgi:hypothetical protein
MAKASDPQSLSHPSCFSVRGNEEVRDLTTPLMPPTPRAAVKSSRVRKPAKWLLTKGDGRTLAQKPDCLGIGLDLFAVQSCHPKCEKRARSFQKISPHRM